MSHNAIYLDYQSTTPLDSRVLDAMLPHLTQHYANPSSPHQPGRRAAAVLRTARRQVRESLGARHDAEIVFTSGATEANHLAILGAVAASRRTFASHVVVTTIEHKSVLAAYDQLSAAGYSVTTVPADHNGRVSAADVAAAITPRTALVSVMYANNEIGTIQPVAEIAETTRHYGVGIV